MYRVLKLKESEAPVKEYRYITTHGFGPGALPKGVFVRSEEVPSNPYKTYIFTNRPLTQKELDYYDIAPEWIQEDEDLEDAREDAEDTIDSEVDQEENPVNEESELDKDLDELREILPDLDLKLYRIASKEDSNNVIYIIGKVSDNNDNVLMLVDKNTDSQENKPEDKPLSSNIDNKDKKEKEPDNEPDVPDNTENKDRFDFVKLPQSFNEINKLNPRYGEDLTPDHQAIMDYLMNCLIEINPDAAEELQQEEPEEDKIEDEEKEEEEDNE